VWDTQNRKFNPISEYKRPGGHIPCVIVTKFSAFVGVSSWLFFKLWDDFTRGVLEFWGFKFGGAISHRFQISAPLLAKLCVGSKTF